MSVATSVKLRTVGYEMTYTLKPVYFYTAILVIFLLVHITALRISSFGNFLALGKNQNGVIFLDTNRKF